MTDDQALPDLIQMLRQLRLREARHRGGPMLTYRDLAARTGWSLGIVAQYFSGKSLHPVDRFDVLVRLLGATREEQGALAKARDLVAERRLRAKPSTVGTPAVRAEIRLLGPVQVVGPKGHAALVGARQRALIALLALDVGRTVMLPRLIDALWGEAPPRTAVATIYSHIARLRRALDACGLPRALVTRSQGYALVLRPDEVDVARFERQVTQARQALAAGKVSEAAAVLRESLAAWKGEVLADAQPTGWLAAEAHRLQEMWLCAQEDLLDARLLLGEHTTVMDDLERLLTTYPVRERLVELSMLALYHCGRHTEAIEAYQRLRGHLAQQLGVRPGPKITQVYAAVLRRSPELDSDVDVPATTMPSRPAQLPPQAGHFVGRQNELAVLNGLLDGARQEGRIGVVRGPAGMGKTALAVYWAHQAARGYPDGQLFLDLRGHDPAVALPVVEALTLLLRSLDVPSAQIPTDGAALIGMYRSALNGRRMLVLLDNAATADQVAPLAPPTAASLLLVTSRNQLAGLAMDYAVTNVDLDVLPDTDAQALLSRVLGADRVGREPDAAREVIDLCGRMPLALRIAAAKLAVRPAQPIAALAADLTGANRLAALTVPGDSRSVRTVFSSAYRALSPPAARTFRRLGRHPGPSFTAALASTLDGVAPAEARQALDELAELHLVVAVGGGRYRFHDLIRLYASECAQPEEDGDVAARIVDWYLAIADAAIRVIAPYRDKAGSISVHPPVEAPFAADYDQAMAFLDAERANLLPVVEHAVLWGRDRAAWQLAYLLAGFQWMRGYRTDQVDMCLVGLSAARRSGDLAAQALMRGLLGMTYSIIQRYEEGLEQLLEAMPLMEATGDRSGQAKTLNNIGLAYGKLGRLDAAVGAFEQALTLHTADDYAQGITLALNNLGHIYTLMARLDLARQYLDRALNLAREIDNPHLEAATLHSLGQACQADDDHDGALQHFSAALALRRRTRERRSEADILTLIGITYQSRGDLTAAVAHFRQALALGRELGDRNLEAATLAHLDACRASSRAADDNERDVVNDNTL